MKPLAWFQCVLKDPEVPHQARLAASIVQLHAYRAGVDEAWFRLPHAVVAEGMNLSERRTKDHMRTLVDRGWLARDPQYRGGRQLENRYRLTTPDRGTVATPDPGLSGDGSDTRSDADRGTDPSLLGGTDPSPRTTSVSTSESESEPRSGESSPDDEQNGPTTPHALAVANGWPPYRVATMTTRQRLHAITNRPGA